MSPKLMAQIRFLCSNIRRDEWSGVLFYTSKGDFGTENFSVVAQELFLMDIGNATYTEYDWADKELVKFLMSNPEIRKMQKGHIHSHNEMAVFFSGTDDDELVENSGNHNYYLSIIVNNAGDICGKVAFRAKMKLTRTCTFSDGEGNPVTRTFTDKEDKESIFSYNCEISTPDQLEDGFKARFLALKEEEKKATIYAAPPKIDHSQRNTYGPEDDWYDAGAVSESPTLFDDVRAEDDANSKYNTGGLMNSELGIDKQTRREKKESQNASVKGQSEYRTGFIVSNNSKLGETADIQTLATRLVALDANYNGLLGPILRRVHKGFWKEPIPDRELKVETYFNAVQDQIVDYYKIVFSRDTNLVNFIARLGNVRDSISLYRDEHPELVTGLRAVIDNVVKTAKNARQFD